MVTALFEGLSSGWGKLKSSPKVLGGRYGLSSKEFTPAMVKAVFDNLTRTSPRITSRSELTTTSPIPASLGTRSFPPSRPTSFARCSTGLGADGTVGANKNSIKIIGEETPNFAQGYFVYDSKKSGSMTVSHLRFGPQNIRSTYLITRANFVACHQPTFLERYDMVKNLVPGGTFLLNTPYSKEEIWSKLPTPVQQTLLAKKARFFVIDATKVARESGMGGRINTIMQVCFFALSGVLPKDEAIEAIKDSIRKTYGKKGEEIVRMNLKAVDNTLAHLYEVSLNRPVNGTGEFLPAITPNAPKYVREVLGKLAAGQGDELPVSAFTCDGSFPTATAQYEKRNLALDIPVWDPMVCIQCMKCVAICPHATIRAKVYEAKGPRRPGGLQIDGCPRARVEGDGTASTISAASSTSRSVGAPNACRRRPPRSPRRASPDPRGRRSAAPRHHPVDVAAAVDVLDLRARAAAHEHRLVEADRAHRANRRVDAAGDQLTRPPAREPRASLTATRRGPSSSTRRRRRRPRA